MTDLLLSSELQGFVPHADYYFESDDAEHRRHLDLLMMVQGWRRYDYEELTDTTFLRYEPEQMITVEGGVYPYGSDEDLNELTADDLPRLIKRKKDDPEVYLSAMGGESIESNDEPIYLNDGEPTYEQDSGDDFYEEESALDADNRYLRKRGRLKKEVTLKGELVQGTDVAEVEMQTHDGGRFEFSVPPYYDDAVLFMMAYESDITDDKLKKYEKNWAVEGAMAKYYVKRDLFFPIFPKKYSYYQSHQPEEDEWQDEASYLPVTAVDSISNMDRTLPTVTVKKRRRRSLHAVDYSKPAFVIDAHELYNLGIDYGMLTGFYRVNQLPQAIAHLLLGTTYSYYNVSQKFNVRAQVEGYTFYRDYVSERELGNPFRSADQVTSQLRLKRQDEIRVYTDLEPRNPDLPRTRSDYQPDMHLDFRLVPDAGERPTYRDRRIILHGFYLPDHFYHRDYSRQPNPAEVKDYRRTLYWNPNARLDADCRFTATFYNNGKPTRMKVSAVGLTDKGQPVYYNK